jgi:transposase InsO family protein
MPWRSKSLSEVREEFALFASVEGANISALCRQFGISRTCGYKWLGLSSSGEFQDRSRRPHSSPRKTAADVESRVLELRAEHPCWGGRKLRRLLQSEGVVEPPSASTLTEILRRHGLLTGPGAGEPRDWQRFERRYPNELWQMDFKGHFAMLEGRCHPLTVLDDCSRFSILLLACGHETGSEVRAGLIQAFGAYGMPLGILCDNGAPWGGGRGEITTFGAWIMRLGIRLHHGKPYHPQTQGKEERFHRTLKAEVLSNRAFADLQHCQRHFDAWRNIYNLKRPHEAIDLERPADRYRPSHREYPQTLPPLEYAVGDIVRKVQKGGYVSYKGLWYKISKGLEGQPVALRPTSEDGVYDVRFATQIVAQLKLGHNLKKRDV